MEVICFATKPLLDDLACCWYNSFISPLGERGELGLSCQLNMSSKLVGTGRILYSYNGCYPLGFTLEPTQRGLLRKSLPTVEVAMRRRLRSHSFCFSAEKGVERAGRGCFGEQRLSKRCEKGNPGPVKLQKSWGGGAGGTGPSVAINSPLRPCASTWTSGWRRARDFRLQMRAPGFPDTIALIDSLG